MTSEDFPAPPPGCPAHGSGQRIPMYTAEFAADPQAYFDYMRHHGPTAPVELAPGVPATLVTDYAAALDLLQNPGDFRKDPRRWRDLNEGRISPDSPVLPLMGPRPTCMFTDGAEHLRLRQAVTESFARVDSHRLSVNVDRIAHYLLAQFSTRGSADLMNDYAKQLPLFVFNELFGCPAEIGDRVMFGVSGIFDGINAERANEVLIGAVAELVALKRSRPGDDVTSWLMQHPAKLDDAEMIHQLVLLIGAGAEPLRNLIANTVHLLLTNDRYAQNGLLEEALDETLWHNPPISNYAPHYPARDLEFAGQKFSAGDLLLVGFQAANASSARSATGQSSNRAHLAWSAGPHACPSKEPARLITLAAIEHLFNELPDVELAVPEESLTWRPGPFNRALAQLPARFTPTTPRRAVQPQPSQTAQGSAADTDASKERGGLWSSFLKWVRA
ncbi:cytochrome P450 [Streptomyces chartreusis]|uniref:cytochrome P450 n=1 Tax=Streptomyces chartreusis TaxID=1969 RepID=UPI00365362BE